MKHACIEGAVRCWSYRMLEGGVLGPPFGQPQFIKRVRETGKVALFDEI
jgi:hypothetical protein